MVTGETRWTNVGVVQMWRMMKVESAAPHSFFEPVRFKRMTSPRHQYICALLSAPTSILNHSRLPPSNDQIRWQHPPFSPVSSSALLAAFSSSLSASRPQPGRVFISSMQPQEPVEFDLVYSVTPALVAESVTRFQPPLTDTSEPSSPSRPPHFNMC